MGIAFPLAIAFAIAIGRAAGVAAGIDMAFHLVETLCGREVADETAR